jgi:hypothetical protein
MIRKYDNTKRYKDKDILLLMLEMHSEILNELKLLNKTIKKWELAKRKPTKLPNDDRVPKNK